MHKKGFIDRALLFYHRVSPFIWVAVFLLLSIAILKPELANAVFPGFTEAVFGTHNVYFIFFLFFIDLILLVSSIHAAVVQPSRSVIYEDQSSALKQVMDVIERGDIKHARMIEVSCRTGRPILDSLLDKSCQKIELLLQHPSNASDPQQKARIEHALIDDRVLWTKTPNLKVRLYRFESTVRGRLFDSRWVNFGWLSPVQPGTQRQEGIEGRLAGHINPMLFAERDTREGDLLIRHFTRVYDTLSSDEFSIPVEEYYRSLSTTDIPLEDQNEVMPK